MNIKFGMDNFYTRYLKRFLNHEYRRSKSVLGSFEKEDLEDLINYISLPNTKTIFEVYQEMIIKFPELKTLFNVIMGDTVITWNAKEISIELAEYIQEHLEEISEYCETVGWRLGNTSSWVDTNMDLNDDGKVNETDRTILNDIVNNGAIYSDEIMRKADINLDGFRNYEDLQLLNNYLDTNKLYISVETAGRSNIFPNDDMKIFVNQFMGDFMYGYAIRNDGDGGADDVVHLCSRNTIDNYKIGLYKCKPRSKIDYYT